MHSGHKSLYPYSEWPPIIAVLGMQCVQWTLTSMQYAVYSVHLQCSSSASVFIICLLGHLSCALWRPAPRHMLSGDFSQQCSGKNIDADPHSWLQSGSQVIKHNLHISRLLDFLMREHANFDILPIARDKENYQQYQNQTKGVSINQTRAIVDHLSFFKVQSGSRKIRAKVQLSETRRWEFIWLFFTVREGVKKHLFKRSRVDPHPPSLN